MCWACIGVVSIPGSPARAQEPVDDPGSIATVEAMDHELGRVLDALTPKQRDETVILFAGDNGSPHEVIRPPFDPEHGKGSLFEGGTGVPFIVAGAGVARPGRESNALVHVSALVQPATGVHSGHGSATPWPR